MKLFSLSPVSLIRFWRLPRRKKELKICRCVSLFFHRILCTCGSIFSISSSWTWRQHPVCTVGGEVGFIHSLKVGKEGCFVAAGYFNSSHSFFRPFLPDFFASFAHEMDASETRRDEERRRRKRTSFFLSFLYFLLSEGTPSNVVEQCCAAATAAATAAAAWSCSCCWLRRFPSLLDSRLGGGRRRETPASKWKAAAASAESCCSNARLNDEEEPNEQRGTRSCRRISERQRERESEEG